MDARLTRGGPLMEAPERLDDDVHAQKPRRRRKRRWSAQRHRSPATRTAASRVQLDGRSRSGPGPLAAVASTPSVQRQIDTQQYVTTSMAARPGRTAGATSSRRSTAARYSTQFRLSYTFKPDLNLDVYAEPFAASGRYYDPASCAAARTRELRDYGTDGTTAVAAARRQPGRHRRRDARSRSRTSTSTSARSAATSCCGGSGGRAARSTSCGSRIAASRTDRRPHRRRRSLPGAQRPWQQLLRRQDVVLAAGPLTAQNGVDPGFSDVK